jgi:hypothetical protein
MAYQPRKRRQTKMAKKHRRALGVAEPVYKKRRGSRGPGTTKQDVKQFSPDRKRKVVMPPMLYGKSNDAYSRHRRGYWT